MERHQCRRYKYPEDRFNFEYWVNASGPCKERYWWYNIEQGTLIINITKNNIRMCYNISKLELQSVKLGWRTLVAQVVRQVRSAIKHVNQS